MTVRARYALAASALSLSCNYSFHASGSGLFHSSSSAPAPTPASSEPAPAPVASEGPATASPVAATPQPAAPQPAAPVADAPERHSKRGRRPDAPPVDDGSSAAPILAKAFTYDPPAPRTSAAWNGTYRRDSEPSCNADTPVFDPKGPDTQVVKAHGWDYQPGFRCPAGCTNPAKPTVANGKLIVPLVWVDDHPPYGDDGYTVTMHRYTVEVPLAPGESKDGVVGSARTDTAPFRWSHNNIYEMRSDGFIVLASILSVKDVHAGTGRSALVLVAPHDVKKPGMQGYDTDANAACRASLVRTDWKPGDGLFPDSGDDDGDDSSSSSSSSSSSGDGGASRKCKSSCRQEAGACRTSCHGASAKCASDCNHEESSCERGC